MQAAAFRSATSDLFTGLLDVPVDPAPTPALEFATLKTTLITRLDPVTTVPRRTLSLLTFTSRLQWKYIDPLEPIMAAPDFPQPMYAPLRDLSPDYVLPGVELVPPNSLGLLLDQSRFIEAYMVGLNHEMARQLLWNGYPTDQRGSYFRQFWDVSAYVPRPSDPTDPKALAELLKDIPPIHTWPTPTALGTHPNRTDIVPQQRRAAGARRAVQALSQRDRLCRRRRRWSAISACSTTQTNAIHSSAARCPTTSRSSAST